MIESPHGKFCMHSFRFNSKSSLLKLLCTLARLCEGTPFQPLRIDFFGIDFPSHPPSQFPYLFSLLPGRTKEQGERRTDPMSAIYSPTIPPPRHNASPHLALIPLKGKYHKHVAPFRVDARLWSNFSLLFRKRHSSCSSLDIVMMVEGGGGIRGDKEDG